MLLNRLVLHNFGVYEGQQEVDLTPPDRTKPLILFGGLNGGGKTTIIDALQGLALYGPMARCSNRNGNSYPEFLRRSIHRNIDPAEGARLVLEFTHHTDGQPHRYTVERQWRDLGKGIRHRLDVSRDGDLDDVLTDSWAEHVESLLPNRLSHLFFFDAEKIEGFADPDRSAELLSTAIHSLLGIDLIDRLSTDLLTLEGRKKVSVVENGGQIDLSVAEQARDDAHEQRRQLTERCAALRTELDHRERKLQVLENALRAEGGDLFEQRQQLEIERELAQAELASTEDALRQLAAGAAPLLLVHDLLGGVARQGEAEHEAGQAATLDAVLVERDQLALEVLVGKGADEGLVAALASSLLEDRESRRVSAEVVPYLHVSEPARHTVRELLQRDFASTRKQLKALLARVASLQRTALDLDRKLAKVPERDAIAALLDERALAAATVSQTTQLLERSREELEKARHLAEEAEARYVRLVERRVKADFKTEADQRLVVRSRAVRERMTAYRERLLASHLERIAGFVLGSLKLLLRKTALVSGLRIDPTTFQLDLLDRRGQILPPERLSAGERQLLAISILWGLAKASGRKLPTVIDTPLGRLDSEHRKRLVDRYFPHASHQVLLLSTDEEIDEPQFGRLGKFVGRSYRLDHDDARDATEVNEGYFFE